MLTPLMPVFIHRSIKTRIETDNMLKVVVRAISFLYIDPLKQGLKRKGKIRTIEGKSVFIHRSIKTRIETVATSSRDFRSREFLYIDPLKQGLKQEGIRWMQIIKTCFYT